jgi:4a-hydroxytetrahydrobiopterin dehydratase
MPAEKLPEEQLLTEVLTVPNWKLIYGGKLLRYTELRDFGTAIGVLMQAAIEAEKLNHHPEMRNVYNAVEFILTTHDAGGLTELDFTLARKLDRILEQALKK